MNAEASEAIPTLRAAAPGAPPPGLPPDLAKLLADDGDGELELPARLAPARLLRGLWLRWPVVVSVSAAVVAAALAFALLGITRHWESVTTLILRQDADVLSIGSGKPYRTADYGFETFLDTLLLPSSLDAALERAGVDADRRTLAGAIDVSIARSSKVMNLKVVWEDPATSAALANALAEVFVDKTHAIRTQQAAADHERYRAQFEDARARVEAANAEVLAFQQAHQVSDFDAETSARLIDLSRIETQYRTSLAEVDALYTARRELQAAIAEEPEVLVSTKLYRNPLRKRLEQYRWQLKEARSRYTSSNPKVQKLEREIAALERVLADPSADSAPENTEGVNGLRQDMQLMLHALNDQIRLAEGRSAGLLQSVSETEEKLSFLSAREKDFAAIRARQESTRLLASSLANKAEEARVAATASESPFAILERARLPDLPGPTGRRLVAAAGLVLGLGLGLVVALALHILDPRVRDLADAQSAAAHAACAEFDRYGSQRLVDVINEWSKALIWRRLVNEMDIRGTAGAVAVVPAPGADAADAAWNVAATLALKGLATQLVDTCGHELAREVPGVIEVLSGSETIERALLATPIQRLQLLPTGDVAAAQPLWLGSPEMADFTRSLMVRRDLAVFSLPSVIADETALELTEKIGAAIVVTRSGSTARAAAAETLALLEGRGVRALAVVVVDVPANRMTQKSRPAEQPPRHFATQGVQNAQV